MNVGEIRLACYSAPWEADGIIKAITNIADCGFEGMECPSDVVYKFEDRLHVFEEILDSSGLKLSGLLQSIDLFNKEQADEQVERAANSARFVGATGKGNLVICQSEPYLAEPSDDDWITIAAIIEEIGCRCQDFGVSLCFMPRAGYFGTAEKEIKRLFAMVNNEVVRLSIDTAEFTLAGLDPAKIIRSYAANIRNIRFHDVSGAKKRSETTGNKPGMSPQFGRGVVKFDDIVKALLDINYEGWITLDISGEAQAPKESAQAGYRFIMRRSGLYPY